MAKVSAAGLLAAIQGRVGDFIVTHNGDTTYIRRRTKRTAPPTEKQKAQGERFAKASRWARAQIADPEKKAAYRLAARGQQTAYCVAVRDYLNPPSVHEIQLKGYSGQAEHKIGIIAVDDFNVTRVFVCIKRTTGELLEEGEAEKLPDVIKDPALRPEYSASAWCYTTRAAAPTGAALLVEATAWDAAGNAGSLAAYTRCS